MWKSIKNRGAGGHEFTILPGDIELPSHCPILGIPLVFRKGKGAWADSPSVDRIDNSKGYIPGNVWVISRKANSMKGNATPKELLKFAFWVYKTYLDKGRK